MTKKMLIDATHAEETRVVVLDGNKVDEFDFESLSKRQLAGNIYLAKVTRVEPSLQAAFVDYGGNRHGFLAFSEIHPDYYQIPKADRDAILAEEAAYEAEAEAEAQKEKPKARGKSRNRRRVKAADEGSLTDRDAVLVSEPVDADAIDGQAENSGESGDPGAGLPIDAGIKDAPTLEDVPPASAASGEIDIHVVELSENENGVEASEESGRATDSAHIVAASDDEHDNDAGLVETPEDLSGNDNGSDEREELAEVRPRRKPRARRYKIQEVVKVRQILLVQVVKEERGNKGAALTTYLSLAGRYCVLMPNTARGGGISRKITNAVDRKKLKTIAGSISVPEGAGLIIRTAGSNRTKTEIKRDYEYLLRQWEQIRDLTLNSIAPCPIYEEGNLVKRAIRDLYSRDIDEILVDGERGYREAKDYMKMLMPSHAKNVKHYTDPLPLFSSFQVESYLAGMFNPVVQLRSGGYIVIDVTEALVAVDVNSGRATRESSIEDTALNTNLEAAEEAARQMRLRDLAGLIVIDFIDMDERRNNAAVEKRLKDKLKNDRARIQIGRISSFGLLEMSRQRLRPGMIEATTKGCPHCHGTGRIRSDDSIALALLREIEEEGVRQRSREVLIVAPVEIANYLLNQKREHVGMIEARFGMSVRVEGDASLISPDYRIERFKTESRIIPKYSDEVLAKVVSSNSDPEVKAEIAPTVTEESVEAVDKDTSDSGGAKKKRRRRRRGGSKNATENTDQNQADTSTDQKDEQQSEVLEDAKAPVESTPVTDETQSSGDKEPAPKPARRRRSRSSSTPNPKPTEETPAAADSALGEIIGSDDTETSQIVEVPETQETVKPVRRERVRQSAAAVLADVNTTTVDAPEPAPEGDMVKTESIAAPEAEAEPEAPQQQEPVTAASGEQLNQDAASDDTDAAPKKKGWWSRAFQA